MGTTNAVNNCLSHANMTPAYIPHWRTTTLHTEQKSIRVPCPSKSQVSRLIGGALPSPKPQQTFQRKAPRINGQERFGTATEEISGISSRVPCLGEYKQELNDLPMDSKGYKRLRERLVKYFGIKMVLHIMERLDVLHRKDWDWIRDLLSDD